MQPHDHQHPSDPQSPHLRAGPDYDTGNDPIVAMDAKHALRVLEPRPGELILDAGCGGGRYLPAIAAAGARPVGVDFSVSMLNVARRDSGVSLAAGHLERGLPFRDATFDAVLCSLVGEHLAELVASLTELRRVLKHSGRMIFSAVHPDQIAARAEADLQGEVAHGPHAQHHSVQDYLDAVIDAGFGDVAFASFRGGEDAGALQGQPLLFLMAATASSPAEEEE
jgi:SAM-dependent methyltransferase